MTRIAAALLALSLSTIAAADEAAVAAEPGPDFGRVGLGVAFSSTGDSPALFVPIHPTRWLRVEPELSITGTSPHLTGRLGLGLFAVFPGTRSQWYVGARGAWLRTGDAAPDMVRVVAAVGTEWTPSPRFALGVEGQAGWEGDSGAGEGRLAGLAFARVYFP